LKLLPANRWIYYDTLDTIRISIERYRDDDRTVTPQLFHDSQRQETHFETGRGEKEGKKKQGNKSKKLA